MRLLVTWTCVILALCSGGLAVSQALSWEWWVNFSWVAAPPALAQEIRPVASPVLRSRFARPVPRGWEAPSLVEARDHQDEPWRPRLAQLGLPLADQASRLGVGLAGTVVLSVGRDAGARRGPPPLAASVRRAFAVAGSVAEAGVPVPTVGSLGERTCESKAFHQPKVTLVKEVPEVVHKPCDRKLFGGVWNCDISCGIGGCGPVDVVSLEREVDRDGYQVISWQQASYGNEPDKTVWKVDRQWYPATPGDLYAGGRLVGVTCNGTNSHGNAKLTVNYKKPDGSDRGKTNFSIKENGTMYIEAYRVWHKDGKVLRDLLRRRSCYRTYERDP